MRDWPMWLWAAMGLAAGWTIGAGATLTLRGRPRLVAELRGGLDEPAWEGIVAEWADDGDAGGEGDAEMGDPVDVAAQREAAIAFVRARAREATEGDDVDLIASRAVARAFAAQYGEPEPVVMVLRPAWQPWQWN